HRLDQVLPVPDAKAMRFTHPPRQTPQSPVCLVPILLGRRPVGHPLGRTYPPCVVFPPKCVRHGLLDSFFLEAHSRSNTGVAKPFVVDCGDVPVVCVRQRPPCLCVGHKVSHASATTHDETS